MAISAWDLYNLKDRIMRDAFDGFIKATLPDILCDIGSCNGDEAVRFKRLSPRSRVYAFEANKQNVEQFINTREDLGGVTVENAAVSDMDGEIAFNILEAEESPSDWRRGSGSIYVRSVDDYCPSVPVTVQSLRLDTYFDDDLGANRTFVLWIDVEGAVDRVLNGAKRVLSQTLLIRAEVERFQYWQNQKLAEEVIATAEKAGFLLIGDSYTPELNEQFDILLVNRNWLRLVASRRDSLNAREGAQHHEAECEIAKVENQKLRAECSALQSTLTEERAVREAELSRAILDRDLLAAEGRRWFEAVIAVTPDHNPLQQGFRHHSRCQNFLRRLLCKRSQISPVSLAARAFNAANWELAVRYYRDALDLEPYKPGIWVQCGQALQEAGKVFEAELAYRKALEFDTGNMQARSNLENLPRSQRRNEGRRARDG
jgi:FkbM family methyltransferase